MPIISCSGCGHGISDRATKCVNCGCALVPLDTSPEPEAAPAVTPVASVPVRQEQLPFFSVATHKFVVMCIVTVGIYQYYWIYLQWRRIARTAFQPISPFWRTFFAPLWGFSLFWRIRTRSQLDGGHPRWHAGVLGTAYLVLSLTWRLPEPWSLISLFGFLPLIPVQRTIEEINARQAAGDLPNRSYSGANVLGIIIGSGILALAVVGMLTKQ